MGNFFSKKVDPAKFIVGNKYSSANGAVLTYNGSEEVTGNVSPDSTSKIGQTNIYKFVNESGEPYSIPEARLSDWKIKPMTGGRKTRKNKSSKKTKSSKSCKNKVK